MKKLTRKELADLITRKRGDAVTVTQVRKNETKWGLKKARGVDLNARVIRYDEQLAVEALTASGVIPGAVAPNS